MFATCVIMMDIVCRIFSQTVVNQSCILEAMDRMNDKYLTLTPCRPLNLFYKVAEL